jgi:hypothetical protein
MKNYIKILALALVALVVASCLDGDQMNTPPGGAKPFLMMTNNSTGGTLVNSGIRYFGSQALLLNPTIDNDTMTFAVSLQGVESFSKDINVTLSTPADALDDYLATDKIPYEMMPSTGYDFVSTSGVIPKGKSYAEFKVVIHPSKINLKKNYMLPITATNDAGITMSSNYGYVYYHAIGNAIAGLYTWQFIRCSSPSCSNGPDATSFSGKTTVFAPVDPTTVTVATGYFTQPNYIITFKDDGSGNLSNFAVKLDPAALAADWDPAGIAVASGPTITVSPDYQKVTIKYTTLTRNVTDVYVKK